MIKLIAISDLHQGTPVSLPRGIRTVTQHQLIEGLLKRNPDGLLLAGDLQDYMWLHEKNPPNLAEVKKRIKKDRVIALLHKTRIPIFSVWGNTDVIGCERENPYQNTPQTDEMREWFLTEFPNIRNCHKRVEYIEEIPILGFNDSNKTIDPSGKCWEEPELENHLKPILMNLNLEYRKKLILLTHTPPRGILDFSSLGAKHIGSYFLREVIEDYQPLLSIYGHVHYCGGYIEFIGRTQCINVSSFGLAVSHDILFGQSAFEIEIDPENSTITSTNMIVSHYFDEKRKIPFVEYRKCHICGRYSPFARKQFKICRVCLSARRIENNAR